MSAPSPDIQSLRNQIELEAWMSIDNIRKNYPTNPLIQEKINSIKSNLSSFDEKQNLPLFLMDQEGKAVQQRNVQTIKVKAFFGEMQGYLNLLTSLTSSIGDGLKIGIQHEVLPEHTAPIANEIKIHVGHVSNISSHVTLALDTLDCILRTVRYTQHLQKINQQLEDFKKQLNDSSINLSEKDRIIYEQALKEIEYYVKEHKEKLDDNIFNLSTSWSRLLLSTTNSLLQNMGVSPLITSSLGWATSLLGIITSSVKFSKTKAQHDFLLKTLADYHDDQYKEKLKNDERFTVNLANGIQLERQRSQMQGAVLTNEESETKIHIEEKEKTSTEPVIVTTRNESQKNEEHDRQIDRLLQKRKEEPNESISTRNQEKLEKFIQGFSKDQEQFAKDLIEEFEGGFNRLASLATESILQRDIRVYIESNVNEFAQKWSLGESDDIKYTFTNDVYSLYIQCLKNNENLETSLINSNLLKEQSDNERIKTLKEIASLISQREKVLLEQAQIIREKKLNHEEFLTLFKKNPTFKTSVIQKYLLHHFGINPQELIAQIAFPTSDGISSLGEQQNFSKTVIGLYYQWLTSPKPLEEKTQELKKALSEAEFFKNHSARSDSLDAFVNHLTAPESIVTKSIENMVDLLKSKINSSDLNELHNPNNLKKIIEIYFQHHHQPGKKFLNLLLESDLLKTEGKTNGEREAILQKLASLIQTSVDSISYLDSVSLLSFTSTYNSSSDFKKEVLKAFSEFQRASLLQGLKALHTQNLQKNQHEAKVAKFNYTKASILFSISLAVSVASLVLSILLFCSVIGTLPAFVFALGPLFLLLSSATALGIGIHFIKKHRPSLYSKIYPAKIRYFAGTLAELILRAHLHFKKRSLSRFLEKHHVVTYKNRTSIKESEDEKIITKKEKILNELVLLETRLQERVKTNQVYSKTMGDYKTHDYMHAKKLHQAVHYLNSHTKKTDTSDELQKDQDMIQQLTRIFFHPNIPVDNDTIEFFEKKMGINLMFYLDSSRLVREDSYPKLGQEIAKYLGQDEDDLMIHMERKTIRDRNFPRLIG